MVARVRIAGLQIAVGGPQAAPELFALSGAGRGAPGGNSMAVVAFEHGHADCPCVSSGSRPLTTVLRFGVPIPQDVADDGCPV